jgi:hypothetical protein
MAAARTRNARRRARVERRSTRAQRRARRFAVLGLLGIVLVVSLLLTAFGRNDKPAPQTVAGMSTLLGSSQPRPQVVALRGSLRLQMPIAQNHTTAVGYHAAGDGALALTPIGRQGNEGLVARLVHKLVGGGGGSPVWYQLDGGSGPATSALDVGAAPGTDVYAPADGTVVGITPFVVAGQRFGARIDIQPQTAPSLIVSLTQLRADPSISVGSSVEAGHSKLGVVVDLSSVERQALARYTQDAGNHVSIEVRPAATLTLS